jgi:MFS family permease
MGVLLSGILIFHAGWYMLLPFLAILFTARRGLTPTEVGVVLATQSLSLLLGSLAGGALADRIGRRWTMLAGLALRTVGVGLLGLAPGLPSMLGSAGVAGFGGGLYAPAAKAAISMLATDENRTTAFSLRGIAANIGVSGGPLLGTLLMRGPMPVLFLAAAALHAALGVLTWWLLQADAPGVGAGAAAPAAHSWRTPLADGPFLAFSMVTMLAWALFTQLSIAMPLYASQVLRLGAMVGLLWTASSLTVILLQVPVTKILLARLQPMAAMAFGAILLGSGLGLVGFARSFAGLLGAVLVFVAGEMLLLPTSDTAVSLMAREGAVGSYFGVASFAWGLGEGLGNLTGGALMQYTLRSGRLALPWALYAGAGLAVGVLFFGLRRWTALQEQQPAAARKVPVYRPGHPVPDEAAVRLGQGEDEE